MREAGEDTGGSELGTDGMVGRAREKCNGNFMTQYRNTATISIMHCMV